MNLEGAAHVARGGDPVEEDALDDRAAGARVLADHVEGDVDPERDERARDHPGEQRDHRHRRPAQGQRQHHRGEDRRPGGEGMVEDGHLDEHPAHPVGRLGGDLEGDVGAERGAPDHGALDAEVVEQRHRLAGEERHRVARHVLGAVGEAVPEQVEGDHPGASLGERGGEGEVHPLGEEQPVHEQAGALPVAVDGVREAVPAVGEGGAAAHSRSHGDG